MSTAELDTFIRKFHQLWNAGLNAHLDLDCHAGLAWVGLRLQLGHPPGPPQHQVRPHHQKSFSSSYQLRRERRSAAQANIQHAGKASNQSIHKDTSKSSTEHAEKASSEVNVGTTSVYEINERDDKTRSTVYECENVEGDVVEEIDHGEQNEEKTTTENIYNCEIVEVEAVEKVQENDDEQNAEKVGAENTDEETCVTTSGMTVSQERPLPIPDVIPVFCIATLENCPDSQLYHAHA